MKKRIYSIIIAVVLMLSSIAAPTKVSALEIPYRVDVTKYTSDEANASAQIREQVKAHANTVTVYVRTKDKDLYAVFNRIWNNAFAETTNPDEGDYLYWQMQDKKTLKRINELVKSIEREGLSQGIGKPEPLRHRKAWSRRIDDTNRLVYNIDENGFLWIIACRGHYEE